MQYLFKLKLKLSVNTTKLPRIIGLKQETSLNIEVCLTLLHSHLFASPSHDDETYRLEKKVHFN